MAHEKWFSLVLHPKYLANIYNTYIRSLVLYGSKLLTTQERKPLEGVDDELIRTYLKGLLKLRSTNISKKHTKRLMLILRIPTLSMAVDQRFKSRVEESVYRTLCQ